MTYHRFWKHLFDLIGASLLLVVLCPVVIIASFLVRIQLGTPILFKQRRPGWKGQLFTIYKFRTMTNAKDKGGNLQPDEHRLTPFGCFLRNTSLDELPELINVLKGEMSLIGPRPLLMQYLDFYTPEQMRRHDVRPGITGWAQINGRNALPWEEKFKMDAWYVDNLSFWLDMKIILLTIVKTLKREGISQEGHVTIQPFNGSQMT